MHYSLKGLRHALGRDGVSFDRARFDPQVDPIVRVEAGRLRTKRRLGLRLDPRYACLLEAQVVLRHFNADQAVSARACLEEAIATDPDFEPGMALLARLYAWIYLFGTDALRQEAPSLADAKQLAQRAMDLDFDSAKAHTARFVLDFMSGDVAGGIAHGERAHCLFCAFSRRLSCRRHSRRIDGGAKYDG